MKKKKLIIGAITASVIVIATIAVFLLNSFNIIRIFNKINPFALPIITFSMEKYGADIYSDVELPSPVFSKAFSKNTAMKLSVQSPNGTEVSIANNRFYADMEGEYKFFVTLESGEKKSAGSTVININGKIPPALTLRKFSTIVPFGKYAQFPTTITHDNINYTVVPEFEVVHEQSGKKEPVVNYGFVPSMSGIYDVTITVSNSMETTKKVVKYYVREPDEFESCNREEYLSCWVAKNGGSLSYVSMNVKKGDGAFLFTAAASNQVSWPSFRMVDMPINTMEKVESISCWVYNESGYDISLYASTDPLGTACGTAIAGKWTKILINKEDFPKYFIPQGKIDEFGFYLIHKGGDVKLYFDEFRVEYNKISFEYEGDYENHIVGTPYQYPSVKLNGSQKTSAQFFVYDSNNNLVKKSPEIFNPDKIGVYKVECIVTTPVDDYVDTYYLAVMGGADKDDFKPLKFEKGLKHVINVDSFGLTPGSYKSLKLSFPKTGYPTIVVNKDSNEYIAVKINIKAIVINKNQQSKIKEIPISNMVTGQKLASLSVGEWSEVIIPFASMTGNSFGVVMDRLGVSDPEIEMYFDDIEYVSNKPINDMQFFNGFAALKNTNSIGLYNSSGESIRAIAPLSGFPTIKFLKSSNEYKGIEFMLKPVLRGSSSGNVGFVPLQNNLTGAIVGGSDIGKWTKQFINFSDLNENCICIIPDREYINGTAIDLYIDQIRYVRKDEDFQDDNPDIDSPRNFVPTNGLVVSENTDQKYLYSDKSTRSVKLTAPGYGYPTFDFAPGEIYTKATMKVFVTNVRTEDGVPMSITDISLSDMFIGNPLFTLKKDTWSEIELNLVNGSYKTGFLQDREPLKGVQFDVYVDDLQLIKRANTNKYTVKFMVENSTYKTITAFGDSEISAPVNPKKDGYNFIGWYDNSTGGNKVLASGSTMVLHENMTLYARFEKKPDSILNISQLTTPFWSGDLVICESIVFTESNKARLFYQQGIEIISVTDSTLKTKYKEGTDYTYTDTGVITRISTGKIKSTTQAVLDAANGWGDSKEFISNDVYVTYRHTDTWGSNAVPEYKGSQLPKTIAKLKNKQPVKILFTGDSITNGGDSSYAHNVYPYQPTWNLLVVESLKKSYGYDQVTGVTMAYSGATSTQALFDVWGSYSPKQEVIDAAGNDTDLIVVAYGMNDGAAANFPASQTVENINQIVANIKNNNPNAEVLVVSPMLPLNSKMNDSVHRQYSAAFKAAFDKTGSAVADVTAIHKILLGQGINSLQKKDYYSMSGNGINHPNDFLIRMYAQTINATLIEQLQLGTIELPVFPDPLPSPVDLVSSTYISLSENTDPDGLAPGNTSGTSIKAFSPWNQYQTLTFFADPKQYSSVKFKIKFGEMSYGTAIDKLAFWSTATGARIGQDIALDGWYEFEVPLGAINANKFMLGIIKDGASRTPDYSSTEFYFYIDDIRFVEKTVSILDKITVSGGLVASQNTDTAGLAPGNTTGTSIKLFTPWTTFYQNIIFDADVSLYQSVKFQVKYGGKQTGNGITQLAFWNTISGVLIADQIPLDGWYEVTVPISHLGRFELGFVKDGYRTPNFAGEEFSIYIDKIEYIPK